MADDTKTTAHAPAHDKAAEAKHAEAKHAEAKRAEAKSHGKEENPITGAVGAVTKPEDPGYDQKLAPDTGGYINIAERAQDDRRFASNAEDDGTLPQATLDEIEAGRAALARRNGKGRPLDAADAAEIQGARRAEAKGNTPQPLK